MDRDFYSDSFGFIIEHRFLYCFIIFQSFKMDLVQIIYNQKKKLIQL